MADTITITAKTKTGVIQDFQVAAILSIDGKPYMPGENVEELRTHLIHMDGRLTALERVLGTAEKSGE